MGRTRWAIAILFASAAFASAQVPQFAWKGGQVSSFRVQQSTQVEEKLKDKDQPLVTVTKLDLTKKWQITDVDAAGVATAQMTLVALKLDTKTPTGESILFDSANLAGSHEQLKEEMSKYVGPVLTTIRIDAKGQLVEVKESKFGPANRLEVDLPFKLVLPTEPFKAGLVWERKYNIKMDPPQGTGETYPAIAKYSFKGLNQGLAVVGVTTSIPSMPAAGADRIPFASLQPEGDVYFDVANGRMRAVRFTIQQELTDHRGAGSKYSFKSTYAEDLLPNS